MRNLIRLLVFAGAFFIVAGMIYSNVTAQDCNRDVQHERYRKYLPEDFCIPKGKVVVNVRNDQDLNGDGIGDLVIAYRNKERNDGDTLFKRAYFYDKDSVLIKVRDFPNLYPVYFKYYHSDYHPERADSIFKKFNGYNPKLRVEFEDGRIMIECRYEAVINTIFSYKYDSTADDWLYEYVKEVYLWDESEKELPLSDVLGPTIDQFNYFWE